ncbi:MAG TPA: hypothetical protein VFQ43_04020, partial [Nitrososphaera sp.]|nr:hypothetical protein [Nitrososphaera sp.]
RAQPADDHVPLKLFVPVSRQALPASFRQGPQSVLVAGHDVLDLLHLLLEGRVVGRKAIVARCAFNQEELFSIAGLEAVDHFFRENHPQGVAEFPDFEFDHCIMLLHL